LSRARVEPKPWRTVGWVLVGTGGAALAVGGITGVMLLHDHAVVEQDCDASKSCASGRGPRAAAEGRVLNFVSPLSLLAGVLSVGAGSALLLAHPVHDHEPRVGVRAGPGGAELVVVSSF